MTWPGEGWVAWKPSIVGPTHYVPRWALDMYRPIAREAHETLRRAEQLPVLPGAARRERAARIRDATRLIRQWRDAVVAVGHMLREPS